MRALQRPIKHVSSNASRSRRPFVAVTPYMLKHRGFSRTLTSREDDKQEEQRHSQDISPDGDVSLIPSAPQHHPDVNVSRDSQTSLASLQECEPGFGKNAVKIKKYHKEKDNLYSRIYEMLTKRGNATKELETLKQTGQYTYALRPIGKSHYWERPWSKEEKVILKKMRKDRKPPRVIARRLGRNEESVIAKIKNLSEYLQECNKAPSYEGPQALSPELESVIFRSRLETVWEGLMTLRMSEEWSEVLSKPQPESWLSMIEEHTPKHVKSILASHQPPDIAQLESIRWSNTTDAGVYGWVLKPKGLPNSFDDDCYLWVGAASKYGAGLESRKKALLSSSPQLHSHPPKPEVKKLQLSRPGKFITFLEVPFRNGSAEEVERIRRLVILAKQVFVIWLAAARNCSELTEIIPWELEDIHYQGLASHGLDKNSNLQNVKGKKEKLADRKAWWQPYVRWVY